MKKIVIALVLSMAMMACTTASFSGLQMSKNLPTNEVVSDFAITIQVVELLGSPGGANLVNMTADAMDPAVKAAIMEEINAAGGDAAINIKIVQEATLMDLILAGITGAIYSPVHYNISGTVIKW
ncbi:MAG: hypothetical protein OCD02_18425 [Spirochaetaceae bacterium]